MNYPLISEYIEAIKAAEDNFEQLNYLRPVLDETGEPVMSSGNFAVVFKMKDKQTGRLYAVKCFLKEQAGRAEAYRMIAEELEYVNSTFLTPIKYLDKELFVDTKTSDETEFPVLLMDWVEGQTLDKYIHNHLYDQYDLSLLAYQFSRLAMWLMPQPFAHGDLKPDNILVEEDGTLVLVDYDGMFVPAMKGLKARELGSPDFRHPSRTEDDFDEHIDDFSLSSILLSLKAISLQPSLLKEYGASDRLLFSENDYRNLSESKVLDALKPLIQNTELASLYSLLILALAQKNLSQVSFRLFNLKRPDKSQYEDEILSTKVTEEDLANAWTDEYGVKYSADRKILLKVPHFAKDCSNRYSSEITEYAIRKGTKVICDSAFCMRSELLSIVIPNSVKVIGKAAFRFCPGLTTIFIPNSVEVIDNSVFSECHFLNSVTISNGVKKIGNYAFDYCINIKSIAIPESVQTIGIGIFKGCFNLNSITVDERNTIFHSKDDSNAIIEESSNKLVAGCSSTSIPQYIVCIGKSAFENVERMRSIIIPHSVQEIQDNAFRCCISLNSIILPNSLKIIGNGAFSYCQGLYSIYIPNCVQDIGTCVFESCYNLGSIVVEESNNFYDSRDNCNAIINSHNNHLIAGCYSTVIPNNVTVIDCHAFSGCDRLESIIIPESVEEICSYAFSGCGIEKIILSKNINSIEENAFDGCNSLRIIIVPVGTKEKFEKLLPSYKNKLVEKGK